jgi:hypothetical protein
MGDKVDLDLAFLSSSALCSSLFAESLSQPDVTQELLWTSVRSSPLLELCCFF